MAKNSGRLAGLAALGAAAYMASKGKDKDKETETSDSNPTRAARPESTETRLKTPAQSIAEADKSDKSSSISTKGESGTTTPGPDKSAPDLSESRNKPAPKPAAKPASASAPKTPAADNTTAAAIPSGIMGGKRQPTNTVSSSADTSKMYPSGVMGGARQADAKSSTASTVKNAVSDAAKTAVKTATQGPATSATSAASNSRVPTPEQAAANRQAVYDKVKSVGSSVADYVKNFETPAERRSREAKEAKNKPASVAPTREYNEDALSTGSAMRRGGAVKKMASGGMTASRRADGIASRGKTRCKMY